MVERKETSMMDFRKIRLPWCRKPGKECLRVPPRWMVTGRLAPLYAYTEALILPIFGKDPVESLLRRTFHDLCVRNFAMLQQIELGQLSAEDRTKALNTATAMADQGRQLLETVAQTLHHSRRYKHSLPAENREVLCRILTWAGTSPAYEDPVEELHRQAQVWYWLTQALYGYTASSEAPQGVTDASP